MPEIYRERIDGGGLSQGDLLRRTQPLNEVLERYHSYFNRQGDYKYFIVLTQSCDLMVRPETGRCSSRYITIAAVRPMIRAVERYAEKLLYSELDRTIGVIPEKRKQKITEFLERLINNNESDYFFLPSNQERGVSEHSCAFLKLSIALKAEHYDMLVNARVAGLDAQYQYKLGYLVGNAYSRVATEDLLPNVISRKDITAMAKKFFESQEGITPVKDDVYAILDKQYKSEPGSFETMDNVGKIVAQIERDIAKLKEERRKGISEAIKLSAQGMVDEKMLEQLASTIMSNAVLRQYLNPK